MRLLKVLLLLCLCAVAGGALASKKTNELERNQYAWSGAVRWGEFEQAQNLIDPIYRKAHPVTALELERYKQVQVSSYRDVGSSLDKERGLAVRDIEIGVINRHTQAERTVRYREEWRWDPIAKTWWLTSGLPDLWDGM
ncbi:hypothetical protein [Lysobacter sp. cf310]|jgi:hypothetical protein|uniref:hypothetical protein n=1 Tax=Lysobacter sp. cf310 TaxID=1761790 RepID=UPI0008EDC768|nr:hypothetical protein [Lysobacter sp. cf310]SFL13681.1 hypothetical protein SAMN04487938_3404 [Lysobacter sp. cf310]